MKVHSLVLLLSISSLSFGQGYLKKIQAITFSEHYSATLLPRLDSLKLTRRAKDSDVQTIFNRSVDFGFRHQRISVKLNSNYYHINLLTINDTICFSSVQYGSHLSVDSVLEQWNKTLTFKVDTIKANHFISLRNHFYGSGKTIPDMVRDLNLITEVALYCGDGNQETAQSKEIKQLAKVNNQFKFRRWLNSICCEEQAYATIGYSLLQKNKFKVAKRTMQLVTHVNQRKSAVMQCHGCFIMVN